MTKESRQYYQFTERNEWENETWHFFLLLDKKQHDKIKKAIATFDSEDGADNPYELADEPTPESEVDVLIKYGYTTYMRQFNKVSKVELPNKINLAKGNGDIFYKGGCWKRDN